MQDIKTEKELLKKLSELNDKFHNEIWQHAVIAVNQYLAHNPTGMQPDNTVVERMCDDFCLSGAWLYDRVQNKTATHTNKDYKKSLSRKIRKSLGYTI